MKRTTTTELTEEERRMYSELGKRNYGLPYDAELLRRYGIGTPEQEAIICSHCKYQWTTRSKHEIVQCPSCYRRVRRPSMPEYGVMYSS